ncbi:hypothetical protein BK120_22440 [Paenibacillus sp. FSL A5-0031]|uniref:DUF2577 domain-containing protein n=1 Tax=Paenibacillus sp. FSL A5-0031 TaxID=1920420 RepID=UPI00096E1182|nr:DUF2577 domain-containing protein [Paenibacillus sp. FSL A5-0031]OME79062.1 hypothetical protein BK120_22440 [Paenibacillus sp. FSL A5-0031]
MALLESIKKAGAAAYAAGNPLAVMVGKVIQINPLEVNVDQRFTLSEDFLIIPESLVKYETQLQTSEKLIIRTGLEAGDAVLMLRVQGGQQFVVLDKVAKP